MVSRIAINYATGWLPGDTRGAFICDGATGNLVGANVLNDDCSSATNWTVNSGWSLDTAGGNSEFDHASGGGTGTLVRALSGLTSGQRYLARITVGNRTAGTCAISLGTATDEAGDLSISSNKVHLVSFTASGTTDTLVFTPVTGFDGSIQDVQIDVSAADRSSKGKDLRVVGTLSRTAVNTGNDLAAFSGFSASNYLEQPYNSDLDLATGNVCVSAWVKISSAGAQFTLVCRDSATTGARILLYTNAGGLPHFFVNDGTNGATAAGTTSVADGNWHLLTGTDDGTTAKLFVDGILAASASSVSVGSLNNASAVLRIGLDAQGSNPATNASIVLVRASAYALTDAQLAKTVYDERPLFDLGAKAFLGGTSNNVKAIDYDPDHEVHAVGTADGVSEFKGLRRFNYWDTTNCALTNDVMKCVSRRAGFRLFGGGADIVAHRDLSFTFDESAIRDAYLKSLIPDTSTFATASALAAAIASIPVKATSSELLAGADDAKFLTALGVKNASAIVAVASGATINTNGNSGYIFKTTLDHNATFAAPTNLIDGKVYTWIIKQGSTGGTGAFNAVFVFPSAPTLSTGEGKYDIVSAVYCSADSKLIARFSKGS